jgi:hypothetical protein
MDLKLTTDDIDAIFKEMLVFYAKAHPADAADGFSIVDEATFYQWWESRSEYAARARTESKFSLDPERAEELRDMRSTLVKVATAEAYNEAETWLSSERKEFKDPRKLVGEVVRIEGKAGKQRQGTVESEDRGALRVLLSSGKMTTLVPAAAKTNFEVASRDAVEKFVTKNVEVSMKKYVKDTAPTGRKKKKKGKKGKGKGEAVTLYREELDSKLSREDLSKLGKLLGMNLTKTELDQAMVEIDVTKTGTVTLDEFNKWFHSEKSSLIRKINKSKEAQERVQKMGKKGQTILDGVPTQAEIVTALFQRLDKSKVGELNR